MSLISVVGPCSWESKEQCFKTIEFLQGKVDYIRSGIWKYRSNPDTYQGNPEAIEWIKEAKTKWDFKYVVEVYDTETLEAVKDIADMYQIGSRNMHNTSLLKYVNKFTKPVLFKRHYCASVQEFWQHAGYLQDVQEVWLCLRGVMPMCNTDKRFQPDFDDIMRLKAYINTAGTNHKVIYDVSHSTGSVDLIPASLVAAKAFGADGIVLECHPNPTEALSDPLQQVTFEEFTKLRKAGLI